MTKPYFKHDCRFCARLASIETADGRFDLYKCSDLMDKSNPYMVARHGDDPSATLTCLLKDTTLIPVLKVTQVLAHHVMGN